MGQFSDFLYYEQKMEIKTVKELNKEIIQNLSKIRKLVSKSLEKKLNSDWN